MLSIVTGSSQNHFKTVCQFLDTLFFHHPEIRCYFYDLGLTVESATLIRNKYNVIFRVFDYSKYPSYFNINIAAGEYAWKPVIIEEVANETEGVLLWMDAGTKICENLSKLINVVKSQGIYSAISSGNVSRWTHPGTLTYLNVDKSMLYKSCRNASVMGFDLSKDIVREFVKRNAECAKIKECIAPEGSSRNNHRQDQAVFTILYYQHFKATPTAESYIGYTIHNDID